jgi:hypothetical protein
MVGVFRSAVAITLVIALTPAVAVGDDEHDVHTTIDDVEPVRRSYIVPAIETFSGNIVLSLTLGMAGVGWAQITPESMWQNLTSPWVWDTDPFTTNQLFHPYMGAMAHASARSSGLGFWTSAIYAFAGSAMWEAILENEPPSLNDQITTPFGGVMLGEMFHRSARVLRWQSGIAKHAIAAVIDWPGAVNEYASGAAWRDRPPRSFGYLAVGGTTFVADHDLDGGEPTVENGVRVLIGASLHHGLLGDPKFRFRRPFDHFDFRTNITASSEDLAGAVHLRGAVAGRTFGNDGARGLWGVFSTYDFVNQERIRIGAIGIGFGTTAQLRLGESTYGGATVLAAAIPYGAAGGSILHPGTERDYRRGIGGSQLVELQLGRREVGALRVTGRLFEVVDLAEGDEVVAYLDAGVILPIFRQHAIGAEAGWSLRRATFDGNGMELHDQAVQLNVFYALINDRGLGAAY